MDRSDTIYTALILDPRFKTKLLLKELEDKESETGKRRGLGEDSALGKLNVGLEELDLSRLIGGQSFTVSSHIARKDLSIVASSLTDTGANGYSRKIICSGCRHQTGNKRTDRGRIRQRQMMRIEGKGHRGGRGYSSCLNKCRLEFFFFFFFLLVIPRSQ